MEAVSRQSRRRVSVRLVLVTTLCVALIGACGNAHPAVIPTLEPIPEVVRSIDVRDQLDLRADREWVEAVLADPSSVTRDDILVTPAEAAALDELRLRQAITERASAGLPATEEVVRELFAASDTTYLGAMPLSPDEADEWERRATTVLEVLPRVEAYGTAHSSDWAGTYLDGAALVVNVSDRLEEHRQAIDRMFVPGSAEVVLHLVDRSLVELNALTDRVKEERRWLRERGIRLEGVGADVKTNSVDIDVVTIGTIPGVETLVLEHFAAGEALNVHVQVLPDVERFGYGALTVRVRDQRGDPVVNVRCQLMPDVPNAAGDDTMRLTESDGTCRWEADRPLPAIGYRLEIWEGADRGLLGVGHIDVQPDETTRVSLTVTR